ncbi:MAG: HEAT repeat domain-containing protein [Sandaracinaceae bacterium]|nr:HEAT repeat domain-containing protein [Sandaracinaceae bacterium]
MRRGALTIALVLGLAACASGPRSAVRAEVQQRRVPEALAAYERVRSSDGPDVGLLRHVAALTLELAAESEDSAVRDAALSQLRRAGEHGRSALGRLAQHPQPAVRAAALLLQSDAGGALARAELRAFLDAEDHEARAAAQGALDPGAADDAAVLRAALTDPSARVRRAAAMRLRQSALDAEVRVALEQVARVDPALTVRVAALQALGHQGPEAFAELRERLSDPDGSVRMAALMALSHADPVQASGVLAGFLATPPSTSSVEAARLLAQREEEPEAPRAADYLVSALAHSDENIRAQAAVALSSLTLVFAPDPSTGAPRYEAELLARLEAEPVRRARLILAQTLLRGVSSQAAGQAALREMLAGDDVPAVMAAVSLSREGDAAALALLDAALVDTRVTHRRIAAAALTRDAGDPDRARAALLDEDALVRVAVAGGILAAP